VVVASSKEVMTTFLLDVRHAMRVLATHKVFTATAVATLAVAIAANTAIFTLVSAVLLKPLPLPEPERLVRVEERHAYGLRNLTGATFSDLRERSRSFSGVAAYRLNTPGLSVKGAVPEQVLAAEVSEDYLAVLGVSPVLGRGFAPADFLAGSEPAVILSDGIWRRMFGANPQMVGRRVLVNAVETAVIGVMPSRFNAQDPQQVWAPGTPQIWLPSAASSPLLRNRRAHLFTVLARLRPDQSFPAAIDEMTAVSQQIVAESGREDLDMTVAITPLQERLVQAIRPALLALWGAVGVVLVISAANIANLLLMLGSSRSRELSIRAAVGADRSRLVRQLVTESLVLGCAGGLAGTLLGLWAVPLLRSSLPAGIPRSADIAVDIRVIAFAILTSLLTSLLFGLVPALRLSLRRVGDALRDRHDDGLPQSRLRGTLVGAEVALAVMLLAAAGLLARSFASVTAVELGFDPSHVVSFDLTLPPARYPNAAAHGAFLHRVAERIVTLPGVTAAGATGALAMSGTPATTMEPEGTPVRDALSADVITASPGFFAALRIPLERGRLFLDGDVSGGAPVMLISRSAARTFWPDGTDPVGRRITMKDWGQPYEAEVVGIVGDVHQTGPDAELRPAVYYPVVQFPETLIRNSIVIRTVGNPLDVVAAAREQVWAIDRDQPVAAVRTMDQILATAVAQRRFNMILLGAFSLAALLLAGLGIYGVVAFAVAERTREIGVRVALGATPLDVAGLTFAQSATPVGLGILAGLAGAIAVSRAIEGLLFGVEGRDPATLVAVTAVVLVIGTAACVVPARRALKIDPASALRAT
jgi:putative ABC transport system permease protein